MTDPITTTHRQMVSDLLDCSAPDSARAVALRTLIDWDESVIPELEQSRIDQMAQHIPPAVRHAVEARRAPDRHCRLTDGREVCHE